MQKNVAPVQSASVPDLAYLTSERFIHDGLLHTAQKIVNSVKSRWEQGEKIEAYAIAWPGEKVPTEEGQMIDGPVLMAVPLERRELALRALVDRTKAFALLLVEQKGDCLAALFESAHGTRSWTLPIRRHGDRWALEDQKTRDDTDRLGLLWSPKSTN